MVKSGSRSERGRQRQLHIVYFVDSNKTRSLQIPLSRLKLIGSVLGVVLIWAVTSIGIVAYGFKEQRRLTSGMQELLSAIFEYQGRYDGVFESAYPDKAMVDVAKQTKSLPPSTTPLSPNGPPSVAAAGAAPGGTAVVAAAAPDAQAPAETDEGDDEDSPKLKIEGSHVTMTPSNLVVTVDLRNPNEPQKAEGLIWAIAAFRTDDGKDLYFGWPGGIAPGEQGAATHPEQANRYSIRHFKAQRIQFPIPAGASGKFTQVKLMLKSKDQLDATYTVPVDKAVIQGAPAEKNGADLPKSGGRKRRRDRDVGYRVLPTTGV